MSNKSHSLLLVDDESDLVEILAARFELEGYTVFMANDGEAALKILETSKIDLVVTDVQMPKVSGVDLLDAIRAKDEDYPIVFFITGYSAIAPDKAFDKGVQAIFSKPFEFKDLSSCVKKFLTAQDLNYTARSFRQDIDLALDVTFSNGGSVKSGRVLNIGKGGMFIHLDAQSLPAVPSLVDEKISFRIHMNDNGIDISGTGRVVWLRNEKLGELESGCGIEFEGFLEASYPRFIQLINNLRTNKYISHK
ncbi:MAG: hypothetical protein A2622_13350 [Bdellovibrionales bacterium RIFCSPHIGHO2_01_FULL_40_29]|nr:MAG: hypothetical protein A2622_13350 [Bdellovibrionales bacterium RIFCSPHIGHO2_01_FULL_40_29]OFZ34317.1 MAG: hypothetical protein A3D17_04600 [Bdellovibrionales bacterium RIFCSPHIGHO2_02_FULL_40_15]